MKNAEDFFNLINAKLWKDNISSEAERLFDSLIEELIENKQEIISEIVDDIKRIQEIKVEEKEEFEYATFKKWLSKYTREEIQGYLEE